MSEEIKSVKTDNSGEQFLKMNQLIRESRQKNISMILLMIQ